MNRFTGAPWPLKAAYLLALGVMATGALLTIAGLVALAGLGALSWDLSIAKVPAWLWYFRGDPQVRRWLGAGMLSALVCGLITVVAIAKGLRPPLHGAARWASEADLVRGGLRAARGVLLGRKNGRLLVAGGEEHVMLYAPTRSGKGVSVVIPNLLNWPDSTVVLDVKRENWDATAGFRAAHNTPDHFFIRSCSWSRPYPSCQRCAPAPPPSPPPPSPRRSRTANNHRSTSRSVKAPI